MKTGKTAVGSFTSVYSNVPHTRPAAAVLFSEDACRMQALVGHLGSDLLIKMPETSKRIEFILQ